MPTNEVVDQFAALLASEKDEASRARLLAKVKMMAVDAAPAEAFEPDVTRLREYLAKEIPIPPSLVWPTIAVRGEITATLGRAGKGKTTMNLNRIFAWAAGRELFPGWTDHEGTTYLMPEKPLRTLVAENEGNAGMFHQKVGLLVRQGDLSKEQQEQCLDNIYIHGDGGYSGMKLDNDQGVMKLRRSIEAVPDGPPDLIFIEPFRSLWSGEENSATDMAIVVDNMVGIATDYNCGIILSHHMRKGGDTDDLMSKSRGSTVLEGVVAVMENFDSVKDGEYREMTWSKARYLPPPTPVRMEWKQDTGWYQWVPITAIADGILVTLREADDEPMNLASIAEEMNETKTKLRPLLKTLEQEKRIVKMPSIATADGSTGHRWRIATAQADEQEGVNF